MNGSLLRRIGTLSILSVAASFPSIGADLLVSSLDNAIRRYDGTTGANKGYFVSPGAGGLNGPTNFIFGPGGHLYAGSIYTRSVKRYDGTTGAYIDDFLPAGSGGGISPYDLAFGSDGNLYVASGDDYTPGTGHIKRFSGTTGAYIDDFVPSGSGGLNYAVGLVFGPDGNLYVADNVTAKILRYNGVTGAFIGAFATPSTAATSLKFGPSGDLYVTTFYGHTIERFDGSTGASLGVFVPPGSGGLYWDYDLGFGPDGNLYATERYSGTVNRFDGATGAPLGTFVSGIPAEVLFINWFPLYNICPLYDSTKSVKSGSTLPIKLQICNGSGENLSSSTITLHAVSVIQTSTSISGVVQDAGNANPDNDFRFEQTLGSTGGYIYNLSTKGLTTGSYTLTFKVTGDSFIYAAPFQVK